MNKKKRKTAKKSTAAKTTAAKSPPVKRTSGTCFTIMPFGGWFDDYYSSVFSEAILDAGVKPVRADDLYQPSTIVADIWRMTKDAKIILADLSGKNPNVFYELGLAHAIGKPVILVVESMDDVPFDLRALRVLEYDKNDPSWGNVLRDKITKAIKEIVKNPLQSVPAAFIETESGPKKKTAKVSETDKSLIQMRQEISRLSRQVRNSTKHSTPENIGPEEAEIIIVRDLRRGKPHDLIFRDLERRGAPSSWIDEKLAELGGSELRPKPLKVVKRKANKKRN